jgi:hypothetical protein
MAQYNSKELLGELKSIANSRALRLILEERREYAQKEVNRFVKEQNLMEAFAALARLEDNQKLIEIIKQKVAKIEKE